MHLRPDPPINPSPYVCIAATSLWSIHLVIFARASVAQHISHVQSATVATGIGGVLGNKGGVATGFVYKESTTMAFVTAHLHAYMDRVRERGENYSDICKNLRLSTSTQADQFLHQFDHVYFFGDLNYRTDLGAMGTPDEYGKVQSLIAQKDFGTLLAADQLGKELDAGRVFAGFREGRPTFAPTYRMEKGADAYSNKKYQNASYTDRVLWRSRAGLKPRVSQLYYDAAFTVNISDHRPVGSGFLLSTRVPYINLDRLDNVNNAANRNACTISVAYIRYDDVVLPRADQLAGEANLDVTAAVAAIHKARARAIQSAMGEDGGDGSGSGPAGGAAASAAVIGGSTGAPLTTAASAGSTSVAASGVPAPSGGEGASIDALSATLSSFKPEDYFLELCAPFLEDSVSTAPGMPVSMLPHGARRFTEAGSSGSAGSASSSLSAAASGSTALAALAAAADSAGSASGTNSMIGSVSAHWGPDGIPDMIANLPEPRWLQDQCIIATLRRKGGAMVGQAEISLKDAYLCMERELPLGVQGLTLNAVLEHPVLSSMFAHYTVSKLASESLDCYRAHLAYQELCAAGPFIAGAEVRLAAAHTIAETFIWSSAPRMVHVSGPVTARLKAALNKAGVAFGISPAGTAAPAATSSPGGTAALRPILSTPEEAAAAVESHLPPTLFAEIAAEVYRAMEVESLPGFKKAYAAVIAAAGLSFSTTAVVGIPTPDLDAAPGAAAATSSSGSTLEASNVATPCAPFCVPLVRDGCTVGVLRGGIMMSSLQALGEKSQRIRELQRFLRRRSSVHRMTASGTEPVAQGTVALDDPTISAGASQAASLARMQKLFGGSAPTGGAGASAALQLNNINSIARLPSADLQRLKQAVDGTLAPVTPMTEAADDYLLLADIVAGAALVERGVSDALKAPAGSKAAEAKLHSRILARSATMAIGSSMPDSAVTTRALRVLLQLSLQRLAKAEAALAAANIDPGYGDKSTDLASR